MNYKDVLIEWIHKVELVNKKGVWQKEFTKRLPSLVMEYFFSKNLQQITGISLPDTIIHGWMYEGSYNNKKPRSWFKITEKTPADDPRTEANEEFIRTIKSRRKDDRFFVLRPKIEQRNSIINISFDAREVLIKDATKFIKIYSPECRSLENSINSKIDRNLQVLSGISIHGISESIRDWLVNIDIESIESILASRCLMNFGLDFPKDIDALMYSKINKDYSLSIIEYKRKYPTSGPRRIPPFINEKYILSDYLEILNKEISLAEYTSWKKDTQPCFGLDRSHANNVYFCLNTNINYIYIIWNSNDRNLENLITKELLIKRHTFDNSEIRFLQLQQNSFDGISRTDGKDSGSFTKETRFQLMIKMDDFSKARWPEALRA